MTTRREAREEAFKILFEDEMNEGGAVEHQHEFINELITGVKEHKLEIDKKIESFLVNWTLQRISLVDKTILRIALYEIIYIESIPHAVSINEAVELAHKYGDEKSSKFINGILSNIVKEGDVGR
ncbi:MAG TPA: transcription antitermination factor NusB [Pseudogracilibacillus sp.]|nr:transcription antitermination factor NusB [Pseudogracilibacillus sp.]